MKLEAWNRFIKLLKRERERERERDREGGVDNGQSGQKKERERKPMTITDL